MVVVASTNLVEDFITAMNVYMLLNDLSLDFIWQVKDMLIMYQVV